MLHASTTDDVNTLNGRCSNILVNATGKDCLFANGITLLSDNHSTSDGVIDNAVGTIQRKYLLISNIISESIGIALIIVI